MLFLRFEVEEGNIYILLPISTFLKLQESQAPISIINVIIN